MATYPYQSTPPRAHAVAYDAFGLFGERSGLGRNGRISSPMQGTLACYHPSEVVGEVATSTTSRARSGAPLIGRSLEVQSERSL